MVTFDSEKFKTLVHYICTKCVDPSRLGATKLNKILWYSEIAAYVEFGEPITGARFVKRQFGPAPVAILSVIEELVQEGVLIMRDAPYYSYAKKEYISLKAPKLELFTPEQISLVDGVIQKICYEHTATSISLVSHNKIWEMAEIGEDLPLFTALATQGEVTEEDVVWADRKIAKLGAA